MSRRLLGAALLCFLVSGLTACASSEDPPPVCGEHNCSGCCKGNLCITKTDKNSCGIKGEPCDVCDTGQTCNAAGECETGEDVCRPSKCTGCCIHGECMAGTTNEACGPKNGTCIDCTDKDKTCNKSTRLCVAVACKANCVGKCAGDKDGCGGKCPVNNCKGCCDGTACITKTSDDACGKDGGDCVKCDCNEGVCQSCNKDCVGKCAGASDGCGGTCPGSCDGCCQDKICHKGDDDEICGGKGADCDDCKDKGKTCDDHACSGCEPDCKDKCVGAPDGCNGTCTTNSCTGCCDKTTNSCITAVTESACGKGGEECEVCKADFEGWSWKCDTAAGDCVQDEKTGPTCQGETGGTVACTDNNLDGKCWEEKCCTGCWDKTSSYCYTIFWNDLCGKGGVECADCAADDKFCDNGQCSELGPSGCANEWGACTDIGGLDGRCINGQCCSGCYTFGDMWTDCTTAPTQDECGVDGDACKTCEWYERCEADGTCKLDPSAEFDFRISEGQISADRVWDSLIVWTPPDTEVRIVWDTSKGCLETEADTYDICTGEDDDTFMPQWQYSAGLFTASALMTPFCLYVIDQDFDFCSTNTDLIGKCTVTLSESDLVSGTKLITNCPAPDDGKNYVLELYLSFFPPAP